MNRVVISLDTLTKKKKTNESYTLIRIEENESQITYRSDIPFILRRFYQNDKSYRYTMNLLNDYHSNRYRYSYQSH